MKNVFNSKLLYRVMNSKSNFLLSNFKRTDKLFRGFRLIPNFIRFHLINHYVKFSKNSRSYVSCPERMTLFLTNECNMKCAHCFIVKEIQPKIVSLTLENYQKLFKSIRGGVSQVLITGGEPTLRKDLPDIIISASVDGGIKTVNLFSNGLRPNILESCLKKILTNCDININYQTSLDGLPKFHDLNRRVNGAYSSAIESIKIVQTLIKQYPNRFSRVVMTTAISRNNLEDLESICDIISQSGASPSFCFVRTSDEVFDLKDNSYRSDFTPEKTRKDGSAKFEDQDYLSVEQMERAINILKNKVWHFDEGSLNYNYNRTTLEAIKESKKIGASPLSDECRMGYDDIVIHADGLISRCENLTAPINLKDFDFDLSSLLKSSLWSQYLENTSGCWCTHDCGIGISILKESKLINNLFNKISY